MSISLPRELQSASSHMQIVVEKSAVGGDSWFSSFSGRGNLGKSEIDAYVGYNYTRVPYVWYSFPREYGFQADSPAYAMFIISLF